MANHLFNMRRLHEWGILVEPGQAQQEGITIPARYLPQDISPNLATALMRLALELRLKNIPLTRLWAPQDGILQQLMQTQHHFSAINTSTLRVQIVNEAIFRVTGTAAGDNAVRIRTLEFWGVIGINILGVGAAIYAATNGM